MDDPVAPITLKTALTAVDSWGPDQCYGLHQIARTLAAEVRRLDARSAAILDGVAQSFLELGTALRMVRDAVDELGPVGGAPSRDVGPPNPTQDAEDIITGIIAIEQAAAARGRREGLEEAAKIAAVNRTEAVLERHKAPDQEEKACWLWAFDTSTEIERVIRALIDQEPKP